MFMWTQNLPEPGSDQHIAVIRSSGAVRAARNGGRDRLLIPHRGDGTFEDVSKKPG